MLLTDTNITPTDTLLLNRQSHLSILSLNYTVRISICLKKVKHLVVNIWPGFDPNKQLRNME